MFNGEYRPASDFRTMHTSVRTDGLDDFAVKPLRAPEPAWRAWRAAQADDLGYPFCSFSADIQA
jgi:hypothetical protein